MKNKIIYLLSLVAVFNGKILAQIDNTFVGETKMVFQSEDKQGKSFEANTCFAYMGLNTSNGDFTLNADLKTLSTGDLKLDTVLMNNGSQVISFKGNINENILKFNQQEDDEKMYDMQGILTVNGMSVACSAQFDPISLADKGDMKNYRLDIKLTIDASNIVIKGLEKKVSKQIVLEVMGGRLNVQS